MTTNKHSCWNSLKPRVSGWLHPYALEISLPNTWSLKNHHQ